MDKNKFNTEDKEKFVEFLNYVGKHAKWEVSTTELISIFKAIAHMQQSILPKIDANILEIKRIIQCPQDSESSKE